MRTHQGSTASCLLFCGLLLTSLFTWARDGQERNLSESTAAEFSVERIIAIQPEPDREKILALLRAKLELAKQLQSDLVKLRSRYAGIDFDTVYEESDLVSAEGLGAARQRLRQYLSMVENLGTIQSHYWAGWSALIGNTSLGEPLTTQVKATFAKNHPLVRQQYDNWLAAGRSHGAAISRLLDFADRNLGKLKIQKDRLVIGEPALEARFKEIDRGIENATRQNNQTRRAALGADDGVTELLKKALTMSRAPPA